MKRVSHAGELEKLGPRVVTIGKFDGIHLGHQALVRRTVEIASANGLISCVMTFDRHPSEVLEPGRKTFEIVGKNQKQQLIEALGAMEMLELSFDEQLANMPAEEFVRQVLVAELSAHTLVVGHDFRFGHAGAGDVSMLTELGNLHGFEVVIVDPVVVRGEVVSSTRIRELLEAGDVAAAGRLLGRLHSNRGMVEHGLKIGRQLGFPTANLSRNSEGYMPKDAVYAGWLIDGDQKYPAALSVGINETIQAVPRLVEAHVLDRTDLDLYDREVTVEYVDFVRPALKFNGVDELISEIRKDLETIRELLANA